jgi:hypothetical protein
MAGYVVVQQIRLTATFTTQAGVLVDPTTPPGPFVKAAFVYHYEDFGTDPANSENFYGLTHFDHTPKPTLSVFTAEALKSA